MIFLCFPFDRISDRGTARPLGVGEGVDGGIPPLLESGLSCFTDWIRKPSWIPLTANCACCPTLHAGRAVDPKTGADDLPDLPGLVTIAIELLWPFGRCT